MQIYIKCESCGAKLGGWFVTGKEQTLTVRPCYVCLRNICDKARVIVEKRAKKLGMRSKRD